MNPSATKPTPPETALLVLDATGTVRAANEAAGRLWQVAPADLAGQPVVSLFAFEVTSNEPGWRDSQWEVFVATSLGRPLALQAQPFEPVAPVDVLIKLQAAHGHDAAYFARLELPPAPASASAELPSPEFAATPANTADTPAGPALLATCGPLGFFDLDLTTGKVVTSPAWKHMLGHDASSLPDTHEAWRGLIHPEDTAALPDRVARPPASGHRDYSAEFRLRHRLGHYVWVLSSGMQIFSADRGLQRVLGINIDITERKETEDIGFASEERIERLVDQGPLTIFDLDFITGQHWVSPSCSRLVGQADDTPASLVTLLKLFPGCADTAELATWLSSFAPGDAFFTTPATLKNTEGRDVFAILGSHRQWSRKHELQRAVGFILPLPPGGAGGLIPAELLPGMLETLNEAVIVADGQARIVYLNENASRLTGWSINKARPFKLNDIFKLVRREDGRPDTNVVDLVIATEKQSRLYAEHAIISKNEDTKPTPIVWTTRHVWSPDGASSGIIVVFRDPQEMTLTPEELIRANRFDSLGQLAGGIAHDFNNLLTTILGGISTAKDNRDYTKLEDAESACLAAKSLTRQLITFAMGGTSTSQQVVVIVDILHDAVRIAAAGTTAVVKVEAPADIAPIMADRGQIIQVFQNLIINALQAMPEPHKGRVVLRAANVRLAENEVRPLPDGDYVRLEVQDNGGGIAPEHIGKIFEPFYTTKKQGTGLGLAIVLSIVRQHGGHIGVDSTEGVGTTFTLIFPKAEQPLAQVARTAPTLRFGTGRVLFLDDDPKICELTAGMLTALDYTHDIVRNGEDAIACYRRYLNIGRPYDVIILDLNVVGGMGGEECFRKIRDLHPEVRAIVNSGYDSDAMARRYIDMGFVGYITKPYRVGELGRAIKAALGKA